MKAWKVLVPLLILAAGGMGACFALDDPYIEFGRESYEDLVVEYGEPVPVHPVSAVYKSRVFHRSGIPLEVEMGTATSDRVGEQTVAYSASYDKLSKSGSYRVTVVDTVPPELEVDETTLDYTARDNVDGDLTGSVTVEDRGDEILFSVEDSSGNRTERAVFRDIRPPVINLGEGLLDYTCWDEAEGDLTDRVTYYESDGVMYYQVTDGSGNAAQASREITGDRRVVYLTFDDGPSSYTPGLLDTLKKYDARATFFVVGKSKYLDLLPRMVSEGHAVGAHTYSHDYARVYASDAAYFDDLDRVQEKIREQLGEGTPLVRFPGGSSNTVSRSCSTGIMSRLTAQMGERGYVYFDWNVSSGDAGATTETAQVLANVKAGILAHNVSVVLQHDVKDFSVAAVEEILRWGTGRGYVFLPLTTLSTAPHQHVAN